MDKIKIGIVDDEKLFIKGMQMIIDVEPDLMVTYQAENGQRLLNDIANGLSDVDIILLDLSMPIVDGVDVLLQTAEMTLPFKIIVLTSHYNDSIILKLLDEGASGFLAKNEDPATVLATIRNVAQRGFYINDYILNLIRNRRLLSRKKPILSELTPREIEVLKLICQEFTNKEIAEKLFISARTVEGHRKSILEKTDCKSTAGLVIYAIEHQIISVNVSKFI